MEADIELKLRDAYPAETSETQQVARPYIHLHLPILVKVLVRMLIGDHTHEAALAPVDIVAKTENPIIAI